MKTLKLSLIVTSGFLAGVLLQSCNDSNAGSDLREIPQADKPIPVKVITPEPTVGQATIKASGQLTTDDETILSFKTGGIVRSINVQEGDAVNKGQVLATLDLTEIDALLSQAHLNYDKANRDYQRATRLYHDSVATLEQLQNAETGLAVAKEQLEVANFNRSFSRIVAPADGYVLSKFVNEGQMVAAGAPIVMTNGARDSKWKLKIGVSDRQWASIEINSKARVTVDAFPGKTFDAVVVRKAETSDPLTGTFAIELQIASQSVKFAAGMFGAAEIITDQPSATWSVPYEAVLDAHDDTGYVFITRDGKTATKIPVQIESFDNESMRISTTQKGQVDLIVSGSAYLTDHSPIIVKK